jgi:hypothetical protein
MKTKMLGIVSLTCLNLTVLWLVLYIWGIIRAGSVETFEQALASVAEPDGLFYLTYVNATLVTLCAIVLFAGLYVYCKPIAPEWSVVGLVFVPVYCVLNLFAYLSQITIVPRLLAFQQVAEYQAASSLLLGQMIQQWPNSAVNAFNNLAYAILGIPSIIFGMALFKHRKSMRLPGVLLALNGVACIVGMVGVVLGNRLIGMGSVVGGVLFLLALIPLSLTLLREE